MNVRTRLLLPAALCAVAVSVEAKPITASEAKTAAVALAEKIGDNAAAITLASADNAPYYIYSRGTGRGYIIVSGDDRTAEIIGYTDSGDFDYASLPDPLKEMLDAWAAKIAKLQAVADEATTAQKRAARRKVETFKQAWNSVEPLVTTHWHQSNPYNLYCPYGVDDDGNTYKSITGCVATAASQIIYYFRKDNPATTLYDTPTYSYGAPVTVSIPKGTPILYNLMLLKGNGTAKQDSAVALLNYVIGTSSWLTYGKSTSGQASDAGNALSGQFNLSNNMVYKSSYSQTGWEQLIYRNLKTRRPLLYTGVNENQGGHAVVLDGYQASTGLYHFNFGWGGQGDGYYTVDDETGMNSFNGSQSAVEWITPVSPSLTAAIERVERFYENAQNTITVTVDNNGTLDFTGIKIYASTSSTLPNNPIYTSEDAIPSGGSMTFSTQYRPTNLRDVYVFVCDASRNILDSCHVAVSETQADLHLNSISVDAGTTVVEAEGMKLPRVNNTTVNVSVSLTNGAGGSFCQPYFKYVLEKYDTAAKDWVSDKNKWITTMQFEPGESRDTVLTIEGLVAETIYRVYIDKTIRTSSKGQLVYDTPDSIVCFTVMNPDLTCSVTGRKAVVGGTWNATAFADLAVGDSVLVYDMTGVSELDEKPAASARNAVIITDAAISGAANVVRADGSCDSLVIAAGHAFSPLMEIKAGVATLLLPMDDEPGLWNDVLVPFHAAVPSGMQVRTVDGLTSTSLTLTNISDIPALTPVLYMKDRQSLKSIEAIDVVVSADTIGTYCDGLFVGSTVGYVCDGTQYLLGLNSSNIPTYLVADAGAEVAPFATMLYGKSHSGHRALSKLSLDRSYMNLADSLSAAYDALAANAADKTQDAVDALEQAIADAEAFFTAASASDASDVNAVCDALSTAMQQFLGSVSGIEDVTVGACVSAADVPTEVYDINGRKLSADTLLPRGLYIIKRGDSVRKVVVK